MNDEDHKIYDECKWSNDCLTISNGGPRLLTITNKILLTLVMLLFALILGFFATACFILLFPMGLLVIIPIVVLIYVLKGKTILYIEVKKELKE